MVSSRSSSATLTRFSSETREDDLAYALKLNPKQLVRILRRRTPVESVAQIARERATNVERARLVMEQGDGRGSGDRGGEAHGVVVLSELRENRGYVTVRHKGGEKANWSG